MSLTKSVFTRYAIYTLVFLLMIASFVPVRSHMICGGCPTDGSQDPNLNGQNGQCSYCGTNHNNHIYEPPPPPPTQAECDQARAECDSAMSAAKAAWEAAFITCAVAAVEPSPAGELACAVMTARAHAKTLYAGYKCSRAEEICRSVG
ncbi:MAG: hypothetical protein OXN27_10840 [Candidatus Poribacteria bacterium]|nr:hypothetical protein [Candidatus Poribacteria bacterium]